MTIDQNGYGLHRAGHADIFFLLDIPPTVRKSMNLKAVAGVYGKTTLHKVRFTKG